MRFTVLRSKAVSRQIFDKQHQPPLVSMGLQNQMFPMPVHCFFPTFFSSQNMVGVIDGKTI